jgi:predicted short-subunit dehydrogenase-like oxidoreductase (DUF2520 family)
MASGAKLPNHIVGPGRLGSALARNLHRAGWKVESLIVRPRGRIPARVAKLARTVGAKVGRLGGSELAAGAVWITVPDDAIAMVAAELAGRQSWQGRVVFHCSGALTSEVLEPLRAKGAKVASVHPVMTFAAETVPELKGVPFGLEGDAAAVRVAKRIVRELGGVPVEVRPENKVLYHAFGAFASPMLIALMSALEEVGMAAGFERKKMRAIAGPLLRQTLGNYLERGTAVAFTGPFVRGDVAVIARHLSALEGVPLARDVYLALAQLAVQKLPVKNRGAVHKVVRKKR